ncbi:MAG: alpha-glucoside transport system substrate-binding protein [Actinomycetota bacterium]|nr:alpha-glucoside transport system substrate-binding protein [Actinomycetota bacterium]
MSLSLPRGRRARALVVTPTVVALALLAACSSKKAATSASSTPAGTSSAGSAPAGSSSGSAVAAGCDAYKDFPKLSGKTVTIFGSILPPESDNLNKSWAEFQTCTGIKVAYEGSNDFEAQLGVRVQGGNAPDIAMIPQPGLLQKMVQQGAVKEPPAAVVANEDKYWNKDWKTYGSVDGKFYAAPLSANMKSLVWYSPSAFTKAGYTVPTTWADMMTLSAKIATDTKGKVWCGGLGSGTATGWPATDWLEEVVLRQAGGQVYNDWVSHKVKFSDPPIQAAMKTIAEWYQNPAWVNAGFGDVKSIATTTFQDAGKPILTGKCWMLQQASFYGAQLPKGTKVGPDGDVFAFFLPAMNDSFGVPVEGGGEFATAFRDAPEVKEVQTYLSTPLWATNRAKAATGWQSANSGVDPSVYTDPVDQLAAKYLTDPKATFRFDASDLMPAAVGSGQEWKSLTAWFAEGQSITQVAKDIDGAWPTG